MWYSKAINTTLIHTAHFTYSLLEIFEGLWSVVMPGSLALNLKGSGAKNSRPSRICKFHVLELAHLVISGLCHTIDMENDIEESFYLEILHISA